MARRRDHCLGGDDERPAQRAAAGRRVLEIHYLPEDSPEHLANRAAETFKCWSCSQAAAPTTTSRSGNVRRATTTTTGGRATGPSRLDQHEGKQVTLRALALQPARAGKLLFPIFRDGTGTVQGIVPGRRGARGLRRVRGLTQESSVIVPAGCEPTSAPRRL